MNSGDNFWNFDKKPPVILGVIITLRTFEQGKFHRESILIAIYIILIMSFLTFLYFIFVLLGDEIKLFEDNLMNFLRLLVVIITIFVTNLIVMILIYPNLAIWVFVPLVIIVSLFLGTADKDKKSNFPKKDLFYVIEEPKIIISMRRFLFQS